jgi:serine protease AprX
MPKMADSLLRQLNQSAPEQRMRVIVRYRQAPPSTVLRGTPAAHVRTYKLLPFAAFEISATQAHILADGDDIERIWLDLPVHIWLDASVPLIGAPQVWASGDKGQDVIVAVVDTGIDASHPDLAGRVLMTQDFSGEGFVDNHGHGTHVAGIIAGNGSSSNGRYSGVAPAATLMGAKVLKGDGSGNMSDVMAGVDWAVEKGANVINLSLGSDDSSDGTDALSQICDAAVLRGVVVCVAAGNTGPAARTIGSPGAAYNVITVGASDNNDHVASFSSRGPTADGRLKPDLCFPGVAIASCRASGTSMGQIIDDYYTAASGTSMATPHCAGAAALLLQVDRSRTPQQIKDLLIGSAKDLQTDLYAQGQGRAQVYEAFQGHVKPPAPPPPPPGNGCLPAIQQFLRRPTVQQR